MRSGRRYTGLEPEDAERLGKILSVNLTPESDFWDSFGIKITGERDFVTIDTDDPLGELKYKFCKKNKFVAQSYKDIDPSKEYVLVQEEQEAELDNQKNRIERKAVIEFNQLTPEQMRKALRLYGINAMNTNNDLIESTLYNLVKESPSKFLDVWVNNKDREISYLIEEAVSKNVIRKSGTVYKYGSDPIGYTLQDAVDYLKNPANTRVKIEILGQLEGRVEFDKPKKDRKKIEEPIISEPTEGIQLT